MQWNDEKIVAWDIETSGTLPEYALQPWRMKSGDSWITSVSLIRHTDNRLVPDGSKLFPTKDDMRAMLERAVAEGWTILGWNIVFDISWLFALGLDDLIWKIRWLDGMLLWRHRSIEPEYDTSRPNKRSYSLKAAVPEFLPAHAGYQDGVDFHSTDPAELAKLQKYNDRDSVFTWVLAKMFWDDLTPRQRKCALIEAECLPMVAKANLDGMLVDTLAARELSSYLTGVAGDMLEKLAPHGVSEKVVRSPIQLSRLMFDEWKLPVLKENVSKKTGKTSRSTDKEVLHELAFVDERARQLRLYREALGNNTKFAETPLASVDYNADGRTRPAAIVFGTYSGRLTYGSKQGKNKDERQTGFALHQEKRGEEFRAVIIPPPGYTLMEFDAAGQEFRWMAIASTDPVMLNLCAPGEDPHSYMASRIIGRDYRELAALAAHKGAEGYTQAKDDRQLGKVANLSLQYRTSARKLRSVARVQYSIPMELPQAQLIHRTYQMSYQRVPRYWESQIALTKATGYVETFAGRRVQVVGDWGGDFGWSMGSTSINYRIQGTGADQKYLAMMCLKAYLVDIGGYFAWDLHDGIYMYIPDHKVSRAAVDIRHILNNLPYQKAWGFTPPIELPWDCKYGKSWGALKEYQFEE